MPNGTLHGGDEGWSREFSLVEIPNWDLSIETQYKHIVPTIPRGVVLFTYFHISNVNHMIQNVKALTKIQKNRVIYSLSLVNTVVCMKLYTFSDSHVKISKFCTFLGCPGQLNRWPCQWVSQWESESMTTMTTMTTMATMTTKTTMAAKTTILQRLP